MTTCLSHGILFCILLASPIQRLYYALLAASNANFHDAVIIPVTLFAIFYHSPQEPLLSSVVLRQELKKKFSDSPAQLADLNGEMLFFKKISKQDIFPYFF